jgi:hypothetical protein
MGFKMKDIRQMSEVEALGYCAAYTELRSPQSGAAKKYVVKRSSGKSGSKKP